MRSIKDRLYVAHHKIMERLGLDDSVPKVYRVSYMNWIHNNNWVNGSGIMDDLDSECIYDHLWVDWK